MEHFLGGTGAVIIAMKGSLLLLNLFMIRNRSAWIFILFLLTISMFRLLNNFRGGGMMFQEDFVFLFRIVLLFTYCIILFQVKDSPSFQVLTRIVRAILIVECITILIAWALKIDLFRAYQWRDGYKGWFVHVNDESFILASGLLYAVIEWLRTKNRWFLGLMICGLLIMGLGSRTALLSLLAVPSVIITARIFFSKGSTRVKYLLISLGLFASIASSVFVFWDTIVNTFFKQAAEMYVKSGGNILSAVLTGRDNHIIAQFQEQRDWTNLLFGSFIPIERLPSQMIESDFFDYLFRFGIIGLLACWFILYRITKASNPKDLISPNSFSYLLLIFLIGSTTGHVLVSSENSPWIAFFLIYFAQSRNKAL